MENLKNLAKKFCFLITNSGVNNGSFQRCSRYFKNIIAEVNKYSDKAFANEILTKLIDLQEILINTREENFEVFCFYKDYGCAGHYIL